jgi:hypothetical protein
MKKIAALFATIALCWPTGVGGCWPQPLRSTSTSLVGVELAQEGGVEGEYSTDGPIGDSAGGPVIIEGGSGDPQEGSAACAGKSVGDTCSFTAPDGQTVNGTCTTIPNQLLCAPVGGMFHYETGEAGSQPEGAR